MRYSIPLTANRETTIQARGRVLRLVSLGAAPSITLEVQWVNGRAEPFGSVTAGFKLGPAGGEFESIQVVSTVAATIDLMVSGEDFEEDDDDRAGTATASYPGTVAITDAGQQIMAADPAAKRVVIYNAGPSTVAIVRGAAQTYAVSAVKLQAGEILVEERFAGTNQEWRGRCDTAGTATLSVEVTK